jgi:hypothetical protein
MFSGFQEILLIGLIIFGIIFLPRRLGRKDQLLKVPSSDLKSRLHLTGFMRLTIFFSIGWLLVTAVYFEPWSQIDQRYLLLGPGPVVLFWGLCWIVIGFRKYRK